MSVGVIVPVRAPAPWLGEALDAVLREAPDAVVVVDDGSEPALVLAPRHAEAITLVRLAVGGGTAPARAAGLAALGAVEWVALCDADDVWLPGHLATAVAAGARADVVYGRAEIVDADGRPTGERWPEPAALTVPALYEHNPLPTSSVVLRRSVLEAVGGFATPTTPPVAEDWDLWLRLAAAGHLPVRAAGAGVRYRRHPGAQTQDVLALAISQQALHTQHAYLVAPDVAARVRATDQRALAEGHVRARDWRAARAALAPVARSPADRARLVALRLPALRRLLGRRAPY